MVNFVLIIICMGAGYALRQTKLIHPEAHKGINTWVLYLALPAVSFKYLPHISWGQDMVFPVFSPFIVLLGSIICFRVVGFFKQYTTKTKLTLILVSGFSNTSFVGFPLVASFFGEQYLAIAIICDQATFFLLSTLGVYIAGREGRNSSLAVRVREAGRRLLTFPPFIGCVCALSLPHFIDMKPLDPLFDKLAATVSPLALFSVGLQLTFKGWKEEIQSISLSLLYKLLIAPVLVLGFVFFMKGENAYGVVSIFEMSMPCLVSTSILIDQFKLDSKIANLTIGVSIIIGLLTSTVWFYILQYLFDF